VKQNMFGSEAQGSQAFVFDAKLLAV
jgi:hypothetical protein